ncbi:MAG TPA: hypothetical protein H9867_03990 [Candidatus Corynebacterium gallistercoris]|uniref:Uncharacterized protein n=1 Tax=Candidatus Corynebacterium gallistercoris TaxID=2838530 RepID=A0A9D1RXP7_9CORY|nr:hypothetical protein [Candidatus Corynebacterium gallistercoris]
MQVLGMGLAVAMILAACSGDGDSGSGNVSGSEQPANTAQSNASDTRDHAAPGKVSELILRAEDAPEPVANYEFTNVGQDVPGDGSLDKTLNDFLLEMDGGSKTDPAQCEAMVNSGLELQAKLSRDPENYAAVHFAQPLNPEESEDVEAILNSVTYGVMLSTAEDLPQVPENVEECATFTEEPVDPSTGANAGVGPSQVTAEPVDIEVEGADQVVAARISLQTLGEEELGQDSFLGAPTTKVIGTVNGVYFEVEASGEGISEEALQALAQAQVDKIRNA